MITTNKIRKEHDMLGAIIGDIVGSTREWHNVKTEDYHNGASGDLR